MARIDCANVGKVSRKRRVDFKRENGDKTRGSGDLRRSYGFRDLDLSVLYTVLCRSGGVP